MNPIGNPWGLHGIEEEVADIDIPLLNHSDYSNFSNVYVGVYTGGGRMTLFLFTYRALR